MIPIQWSERAKIPNLSELVQNYHERGGAIIEYERIWSAIYLTHSSPVFAWVPPGHNRSIAGIKHAVFCLLLGWWSPSGLFWTLPAVINNLMGGVDVSQVLAKPPPLPGESYAPAVLKELIANRRRQKILGYVSIPLVIGAIVYYAAHDSNGPHR